MNIDKSLSAKLKTWSPVEQFSTEMIPIADYIEKTIEENEEGLTDLAHARMYKMITSDGISWEENEDSEKIPIYNFFNNKIFGLKETLNTLVNLFNSGGRLLPVRKRIIMLMGPVGGGKSSIAALLKDGLRKYTQTENGAIYAIDGCPIHENPLNALPEELRENLNAEYGIYTEGKLCPMCQYRLNNEFKGDFRKFNVKRIYFS